LKKEKGFGENHYIWLEFDIKYSRANALLSFFIPVLGSGALAALISGVFGLIRDRKASEDGVRAGVRQLLYDKIKYLGRKYIAAGEVSEEDLEDLIDMHKIYHDDLDGNGYLDHIMTEVKKLRSGRYSEAD